MDNLQHQIALTLVPQVGAVTAKILVSYCGSAEGVFRAGKKELSRIPGIGPALVNALSASAEPLAKAERELVFLEQHGIEAVFYTDNRYPTRLRHCQDAPALLFFKGSAVALLESERVLAIVGTRQPSEQGKAVCEEIVEGLKSYDVLVVSGLAFGIDVTAHRKACSIDLPNIGVLGHGLGSIYPAQHRSVAQKMIENGGLLSEYPGDTKPDREHFPMRNRIISGMADATLVVESAESGGSMITADCAARYGREVFAIPGRPNDTHSAGCNKLIKTERAKLAESAADIALMMNWMEIGSGKPVQTKLFPELGKAESTLFEIIRKQPEISIDELALAARLPAGELAARLLELEFKGLVRNLPGKRYAAQR